MHHLDPILSLNSLALLPSPERLVTGLPGVVSWDICVKELAPGKVVLGTQFEKGQQLGHGYLTSVESLPGCCCIFEVDPLSILQVDIKMHDRRVTLMDRECQNPPHSLTGTDIAALLVGPDLITVLLLLLPFHGEDDLVTACMDVLADVLD